MQPAKTFGTDAQGAIMMIVERLGEAKPVSKSTAPPEAKNEKKAQPKIPC